MHFFKKKYVLDPLFEQRNKARRSFIKKTAAVLLGAAILTKIDDVYSMDSKTGYVYIKQNGEVINNYSPSGTSEPFLGQIGIFSFSLTPNNWMKCDGATISLFQYSALFSLLGIYYGGNGTTNFKLPDFRGRVPIHAGSGAGLSTYNIGDYGGSETVSLTTAQMPQHTHFFGASSGIGTASNPSGKFLAQNAEGMGFLSGSANSTMNAAAVTSAGLGNGHNNIQPVLALNFCIASQGIFPTRP